MFHSYLIHVTLKCLSFLERFETSTLKPCFLGWLDSNPTPFYTRTCPLRPLHPSRRVSPLFFFSRLIPSLRIRRTLTSTTTEFLSPPFPPTSFRSDLSWLPTLGDEIVHIDLYLPDVLSSESVTTPSLEWTTVVQFTWSRAGTHLLNRKKSKSKESILHSITSGCLNNTPYLLWRTFRVLCHSPFPKLLVPFLIPLLPYVVSGTVTFHTFPRASPLSSLIDLLPVSPLRSLSSFHTVTHRPFRSYEIPVSSVPFSYKVPPSRFHSWFGMKEDQHTVRPKIILTFLDNMKPLGLTSGPHSFLTTYSLTPVIQV